MIAHLLKFFKLSSALDKREYLTIVRDHFLFQVEIFLLILLNHLLRGHNIS